MKKVLKSRIFIIVICGIIFTGLGVYGATIYPYQAREISYTPSDGEPTNVNDALNELYKNKNELGNNPVVISGNLGNAPKKSTSTSEVTIPSGGTTLYLISMVAGIYTSNAPYISSTNNIIDTEQINEITAGKADTLGSGYKVIKYTLDTTEEIVVTLEFRWYASVGMNCYTLIRI